MEHIQLGCVVATRAIEREMRETWGFEEFCNRSLTRHYYQDWGDLCDDQSKKKERGKIIKNSGGYAHPGIGANTASYFFRKKNNLLYEAI